MCMFLIGNRFKKSICLFLNPLVDCYCSVYAGMLMQLAIFSAFEIVVFIIPG